MTKQEALKVLEEVTGQMKLNRTDHQLVIVALQTVSAEVEPVPTKPTEPKLVPKPDEK
jgi:hypothetical protein